MNPFSIWGLLGSAAIAALLSIGATHYVDALAYGHTIDGLKLTAANKNAADVTTSLNTLQGFISVMHTADANYNAALDGINKNIAALDREFRSATQKPLPVDCKPDAARLHNFNAAIAAANGANPAP